MGYVELLSATWRAKMLPSVSVTFNGKNEEQLSNNL